MRATQPCYYRQAAVATTTATPVVQALRAAGIGLDRIVDIVTGAAEAPPLNTIDPGQVFRWADRVAKQMVDPRRARRLRRVVADLLDAQFRLDYHAAEHTRSLQRHAGIAAARRAGTYWRDRDARRTATRPIHVAVDPEAWQRMKLDALRRGSTLGEAVGDLVRVEVGAGGQTLGQVFGEVSPGRLDRQGQPASGRRARVFARVVVEDDVWTEFKILADERRLTVARAVGLLVERSAGAT